MNLQIRPLNSAELQEAKGTQAGADGEASTPPNVMDVDGSSVVINDPATGKEVSRHAYDYVFDSRDPSSGAFAGQQTVYNVLGAEILETAFQGRNVAFFTYGQTGSGKTYSTFGSPGDAGLVPLVAHDVVRKAMLLRAADTQYSLRVSMVEVYMESVNDLLSGEAGLNVSQLGARHVTLHNGMPSATCFELRGAVLNSFGVWASLF